MATDALLNHGSASHFVRRLKNQEMAKDFLSFLLQPVIIDNYLKAAGGRHSPVSTSLERDSLDRQRCSHFDG